MVSKLYSTMILIPVVKPLQKSGCLEAFALPVWFSKRTLISIFCFFFFVLNLDSIHLRCFSILVSVPYRIDYKNSMRTLIIMSS